MNLLFTHPQRFHYVNNNYYVGESLSSSILSRYTNLFTNVTFVGRVSYFTDDVSKMEKITNNNLNIKDINKIKDNGLKEEVRKADYIITRLPSSLGLKTIKYAKKFNKPYFIELVGCPFDSLWNHSYKGKPLAILQYFRTKQAILNAPFVLYVSSEFLPKRYPTRGRFISCSDVMLDELDEGVLTKRLANIEQSLNKQPIILGTIGAINIKYKGHKYVIKAISKLKRLGYNFEYWLVGNGSPEKIIKLSKRLKINDNVKVLGGLPHSEVFNFLDNIDIYVQPSLTEGLPRAVLEAMSRACPVIASNVGGIPELLNKDVLFRKKKVNEISSLLISLDTPKLKEEANRNFEFIKQFDKTILDRKRNEFYREFISSR